MKIIVISPKDDKVRQIALTGWARVLLSVCLLAVPAASGLWLGMALSGSEFDEQMALQVADMQAELEQQVEEVELGKEQARNQIDALTLKMAEMQARLTRLDALGERLTAVAQLEDGEFDFAQMPALGGPDVDLNDDNSASAAEQNIGQIYADLQAHLNDREEQLAILGSLLTNREIKQQQTPEGRPVRSGWLSSYFGRRTDPFHGKTRWHNGVDFAGKEGSDVLAVASGVVTFAGENNGYGEMVEIDHGEGYVTRYAHNKENLVAKGDIVKKGAVVALMGNTGRSTGPHVHFEVYKNGRAVDPATYIRQTRR